MPAGFGNTAENCRVSDGGLGKAAGAGGTLAPDAAAVAALASSPVEENRSAGFLAMPLEMTSSNARLIPRRMMLGRGGVANMGAIISCLRSAVSNGGRPVRDS